MAIRKFYTMSDSGGVAAGTEECFTLLRNGYGDGDTLLVVADSDEEAWLTLDEKDWEYDTLVKGSRVEIPDYDCPSTRPWFDGTVHDWTPVVVLDGVYAVYHSWRAWRNHGAVAFVRVGDFRPVR